MNKKAVIIAIIILLLIFVRRATAQTPSPVVPISPDNDSGDLGIYSGKYKWTYYRVKSGDTLFKIAQKNIPLEKAKLKWPDRSDRDLILWYASQLAESNGFDWALFDSKPSSNLRDPDTLKPNQKLVVWSWESFRINDDNGFLLTPNQYIEFGTWTPVADAPDHMKEAFASQPPR